VYGKHRSHGVADVTSVDLCAVFGGVVTKGVPGTANAAGVFVAKKAPEPVQRGAP
jgi:hypothetical protein